MFTQDSFCNAVWGATYIKVNDTYDKSEYNEFTIPKKNGVRHLFYLKKDSKLYSLQQKLLHNYLAKISLPTCVVGFRRGESYRSYLSPHVGSAYFLRIDIKDFFPSITSETIIDELKIHLSLASDTETDAVVSLIADMVTLNDTLIQGASTSPAISNIVMARIDQRILKYCQIFNITYTRYADDLLFSSKNFDFTQKGWFFKKIKYILKSQKFKVNHAKTKYGKDEISLNGYVIGSSEIRLSRKRLSDIRHVLSRMQQNHQILIDQGEAAFLGSINSLSLIHRDLAQYSFSSLFLLIQYLCGYRAFLISWLDSNSPSSFQKELQHLIDRTERTILQFS